jgi:hypothetical protein
MITPRILALKLFRLSAALALFAAIAITSVFAAEELRVGVSIPAAIAFVPLQVGIA